jgi:copper chaperone CopZ
MQVEVAALGGASAAAATQLLLDTPGVASATADVAAGMLTATIEPTELSPAQVVAVLAGRGFKAQLASGVAGGGGVCIARFAVDGMVCGSCSAAVTNQLLKAKGVESAAVSAATHSAEVHYRRGETCPEALREAIEDTGFDATTLDDTAAHTARRAILTSCRGAAVVQRFSLSDITTAAHFMCRSVRVYRRRRTAL